MSTENRASFGGKLSAILVAAGSAIGLGSIWRFPYLAGENGGAAFLLVYLLCVLIIAIPVMLCEFAIGRKTHKNAVGGFRQLSKPWQILGFNGILCALFISGYYYVIAGWSLDYLVNSINGSLYTSGIPFAEQYATFQASNWPVVYTIVFILLTHFIIARGVEKGIEKASNVMMPILFVILIFMAIRVAFMPGAAEGYRFFLTPDFKEAFSSDTLFQAAGQAFFSLSVGMGCMITYASYFNEKTNLIGTSLSVSLLTLFVATLAGLVIFPAVFSAGLQPTEGPSLIFITLPEIFKGMPGAPVWSAVFFVLIALAALTSTISFHEVLTAYLSEEHKLSRKVATYITTGITIVLSLVTLLVGFNIEMFGRTFTSTFDIYDFGSANILLPLGGFFTCIFVGWFMKPDFFKNEINNYGKLPVKILPILFILVRYVAPVIILYIFVKGLGFI